MEIKKTIVTVTGIRPDFIRMSQIFKKLDENFNHILIHTGQHFDKLLSDVFFDELEIRPPDYNLQIGALGKEHYHQTSELSVKLIELLRKNNINPDLVLFLGDSNSVISSVSLKKEGYKIGHIEAGMRSYDKRMLEEINRVVCDHCSDYLFVYHENYKQKAIKENINPNSIFVVGNTIVEVVNLIKNKLSNEKNNFILLDIHRPENFKFKNRMSNIFEYCKLINLKYGLKIKMLSFKRTIDFLSSFGINPSEFGVEVIDLMSFKKYLQTINSSLFLISDSGTAQEEPSILNVPVIVPRDYTERPESVINNCSYMLDVNDLNSNNFKDSFIWLDNILNGDVLINSEWLGDGTTSDKIIKIINDKL